LVTAFCAQPSGSGDGAALSTNLKTALTIVELLQLSKLYLRLAEQADKNSRLDVTYEPPFRTASPAP
jgi:hypothetical protein